jgi:hypothetical protein
MSAEHPYKKHVPSTLSEEASRRNDEEYDSSDEEEVNAFYTGTKQKDWKALYLEEKRKRKLLSKFIRDLL